MENIEYNTCPICNEKIPDMKIVKGTCRRYHMEKKILKKFSAENNMDPEEVPEELKDLTEIKVMLIVQIFTMMSMYRLRGGQTGYKENVINFLQDIQEFTKRLSRKPSTLDVLVVQRQSTSDIAAFRDFNIRREKIIKALLWLKANNKYYKDISINNEIL